MTDKSKDQHLATVLEYGEKIFALVNKSIQKQMKTKLSDKDKVMLEHFSNMIRLMEQAFYVALDVNGDVAVSLVFFIDYISRGPDEFYKFMRGILFAKQMADSEGNIEVIKVSGEDIKDLFESLTESSTATKY
jgi:hypothetical protein